MAPAIREKNTNEPELKTMPPRAAIYARVSTTGQKQEGFSLPTQIVACHKYAEERGYQVVAEYEEDHTGTEFDRPKLDMIRELKARGEISVLVVYDVDRLAREMFVLLLIEREFEDAGVRIEFVQGQYENTPEGAMQKQFKGIFGEYEKNKIIERMNRGKIGKVVSGSVMVGKRPPYGYTKQSDKNKRTWLVVDESEERVVRQIFDWYVNGNNSTPQLSMNSIAEKLTQMRIPTRGDKDEKVAKKLPRFTWRGATIRNILKREAYLGTWHYGKTKMVNGNQVTRAREEWIAVEIPAIIDENLFLRAQERMKLNLEQSKRSTKYKYLMGRRLRCDKCGYTYTGRTRRANNQYYYCKGREQKPIAQCDMPQFRARDVNDAVWAWVEEVLLDPDNLVAGLSTYKEAAEDVENRIYDQLQIIEDEINSNQAKLEKLVDLYLTDGISRRRLDSKEKQLTKTLDELDKEKERILGEIDNRSVSDEHVEEIIEFAKAVRESIEVADFETKRRVIDLLDVRGKLAIENEEKVVKIECKLEVPQRSLALTSPLSSIGAMKTTLCASPAMARSP